MNETLDIQKAVLGMVLVSVEVQHRFSVMLKKPYFTNDICIEIYTVIEEMVAEKMPIDILTVTMRLKKKKSLLSVTDITYLTSRVAQVDRFNEYCLILQDEFVKKEIVAKCHEVLMFAMESNTSGIDIANKLQKSVQDATVVAWSNENVMDSSSLMKKSKEEYEQGVEQLKKGEAISVPTGSQKLDAYTGGWQKGHFIVIGGRPGMGKSRMLLQHLWAAADAGFNPIMFTLEMTESDVNSVMVTAQANGRINPKDMRNRTLTEREIEVKSVAEGILASKKYYLSSERNLSQIRSITHKYVKENGTGIIFIDFIQKIMPSGKHSNANSAITEISAELKNLAKDLNIPVVAIASLSRKVEDRGGLKRPELQDIRESGSIESEADEVLFVWRPSYYEFVDPETDRRYTNETYYLHGKGRFSEEANLIFYHDKYMAKFFDKSSEVDAPALPTPVVATDFRSFTDPQWDRNDDMI